MKLLARVVAWLRDSLPCRHAFRLRDLEGRMPDDLVRWPCARCGRVFAEHCGLSVLAKHGRLAP